MALLRPPFLRRFGSVPAPASVVTETPAQGRWTSVTASSAAWAKPAASQTPRFEAVKWSLGRQEWNGGTLTGRMNFVVSEHAGFLVSSEGAAIISSEATLI